MSVWENDPKQVSLTESSTRIGSSFSSLGMSSVILSSFSGVSFVGGGEGAGMALGADCLVTRLGTSREGGRSFFGPGL